MPHPREHSANLIVLQDLIQEQKAEIAKLMNEVASLEREVEYLEDELFDARNDIAMIRGDREE